MPCYHPLDAWRKKTPNKSGKYGLLFKNSNGDRGEHLQVPCGQCIGCRLEHSRQWAIRCVHEASLHEENCFITLTYSPEHLPANGSLDKTHFQKFMKRFRKKISPLQIKFYQCGEYGDKNGRPHYHACIFGYDFPDKQLWKQTNVIDLFVSNFLENLWPYGFSTIGAVTFESAAYCARYIMKKVTGDAIKTRDRYEKINEHTGEITSFLPEYTTMSRGGRTGKGLATGWFEKYHTDVYPDDFIIINNKKLKPPKYYDLKLEQACQEKYQKLQQKRKETALLQSHNNTPERLAVRKNVKLAQLKQLPRNLEENT